MPNDLVSVYIPTRNRAELLERALDSVLAQTYEDIEILVCDDASTDSTPDVLERYGALTKNLVVLRNEEPEGACLSRNRAISAARGHFITGLDDDDEFLPNRIQCFVDHWDDRWSCLSALTISVEASGRPQVPSRKTRAVRLDDMLYMNFMGNQVFCPTDHLRELGGFDPKYPALQDYELWTRLISRFGPGLRIGYATQRVHVDHGSARISEGNSIEQASGMFGTANAERMSAAHRRAQMLFLGIFYPQLGRPSFTGVFSLMGRPIFRELLGSYLHLRWPGLVQRASGLRRRFRASPATPVNLPR